MMEPLHLTPFEQCMVYEHCAAYPCCCFLRLRFQGTMDRECFGTALAEALRDHPLLTATLQPGHRPRWIFEKAISPQVSWSQGRTGGPLPSAAEIDLQEAPGLHTFVVQSDREADVTFQFHHACCDGAGIDRFAEDFLIAYATHSGGPPMSRASTLADASRLPSRGSYGQSWRAVLRWLPKQSVGLVGAAQFWGRRPRPILAHSRRERDTVSVSHYPSNTSHRLDSEDSLTIRKAAASQKVAMHELVVRDFFLALWEWQKECGEYEHEQWVRMMIPVSMRTNSYRSLPAMNYVSSIFLDRRGADGDEPQRLLDGIQAEMNLIKKYELKFTFLVFIKLLSVMPSVLKRSVQRDACKVSVIFSSFGKWLRRCPLPRKDGCLEVGDMQLIDIDGLAPLRPYNCVTVFTSEYANRFKINLHYDSAFISEARAEDLLRFFMRRLHDSTVVHLE